MCRNDVLFAFERLEHHLTSLPKPGLEMALRMTLDELRQPAPPHEPQPDQRSEPVKSWSWCLCECSTERCLCEFPTEQSNIASKARWIAAKGEE